MMESPLPFPLQISVGGRAKLVKPGLKASQTLKPHVVSINSKPHFPVTNFTLLSAERTDGKFEFRSETIREVGNSSRKQKHQDIRCSFGGDPCKANAHDGVVQSCTNKSLGVYPPVDKDECQNRNFNIDRSGLGSDGTTRVGVQVGQPGKDSDKRGSMQEGTAVITSANLMRILFISHFVGEEDVGVSSDLDSCDGEQEQLEAPPSIHKSLHGDDLPDRMDLEGGGFDPTSC